MIARRNFLGGAATMLLLACTNARPRFGEGLGGASLQKVMADCEAASGGRLGVALLDTGSGERFSWRGDERFAMCSTFKFLLAGAVLARVDGGAEDLARTIPVTRADLVPYAPFSETRVDGPPPSVAELCEAALTLSDNVAANLLLRTIDGPAGLTTYVRSLGDGVSQLDRIEPALNEALPGDPRDTTSPVAMLADLKRLLVEDALSPGSRAQLVAWMVANRTGDTRLRAGLPQDWRVGDKTGTGERGSANDIAIIWPARRPPLLLTVYLTQATLDADGCNALHARIARAVADALGG